MFDFYLINFLRWIGIYNYLKLFKDKYFENPLQKDHRNRMIKFYSDFIHSGCLCFDIGANYGYRTEAFLQIGAKVIAVEPQKQCVKFMKLKFKDRLIILNNGVGSEKSRKKFFVSNAHALSSFSQDWINKVISSGRFGKISWKKEVIVDMITLDDLIIKFGEPYFIKIDVEGYELEVLKGLTRPVNYLSFEVTIPENIETAQECLRYLKTLGEFECNISPGETLCFLYDKWISPEMMIKNLKSLSSKGVIDGDVYVKFLN